MNGWMDDEEEVVIVGRLVVHILQECSRPPTWSQQ